MRSGQWIVLAEEERIADAARLKRFKLGGVIQNKEYTCTPEGASKILFFAAADPPTLYAQPAPRGTFLPG